MAESSNSTSSVPVTGNFIKNKVNFSRKSVVIFIVLFAVVGGFLLWKSFAASTEVARLEVENMQLPLGAKKISDKASTGYVAKFSSNGTATSLVTLPNAADSISISARYDLYDRGKCSTSPKPKLSVVIDGKVIIPATELTGSYAPYKNKSSISLTKGQHKVNVIGSDLNDLSGCDRLMRVDMLTFYGSTASPKVSLSAAPLAIEEGKSTTLFWSTESVASCTASWGSIALNKSDSLPIVLNKTTQFTLSCKGNDGAVYTAQPQTVTVTQSPVTPPVTSAECKGSGTGWNGLGGNSYPSGWLPADCPPYSKDSPFNKLVESPVVHPQSKDIITNVLSGGIGSLSTGVAAGKDYAHPIYYAQATDPEVKIDVGAYSLTNMKIRIPTNAQPALSDDGHISIVQPDGWEYDFWRASRPNATTLKAEIGYRQKYDGLGIVTSAMTNADKTVGGTTAPYFGLHAGIIRGPELLQGKINHALFIVISCGATNDSFGYGAAKSTRGGAYYVYPAFKGDAGCSGVRPPMGARFWLDRTSAQIDATAGLAGWEKTIAKAMNQYGGYMGDTGGPGFGFQFESSTMYTSLGVTSPFETVAKANNLKKDPTYGYTFRPSTAMQTMFKTYLHVITPPKQQ